MSRALALLAAVGPASAHERPVGRDVVLQVDGQGVTFLMRLELSRARAALLFQLHDSDRDGRLSAPEARALAPTVAAKALRGMHWQVNGAEAGVRGSRAHVESASPERVAVLVLGELVAPEDVTAVRDIGVHVDAANGTARVQVQCLGPASLVNAGAAAHPLARDRRGLAEPVTLGAGDALHAAITWGGATQ